MDTTTTAGAGGAPGWGQTAEEFVTGLLGQSEVHLNLGKAGKLDIGVNRSSIVFGAIILVLVTLILARGLK